jgi:predicted nucleic acid-binding protein
VNIFLDTSALVAVLLEAHPAHSRVWPWVQRIEAGSDAGFVSTHSLAELHAILTTFPTRPRILPVSAQKLIRRGVLDWATLVSLSEADYVAVVAQLSEAGIIGGVVYDALILHAATKAAVDQIVTLNERHFRRVRPDLADKIVSP